MLRLWIELIASQPRTLLIGLLVTTLLGACAAGPGEDQLATTTPTSSSSGLATGSPEPIGTLSPAPSTAPSVSPPSPEVTPSVMPTRSASTAPASVQPSAGPTRTMPLARGDGRQEDATLTLIDNAGIVASIRPGTPFEPRDRTQAQLAPVGAGGFSLTWSMFYCATDVTITLDRFEDDVVATVEEHLPAGGCDSIGDDHAVEITLTTPIPFDHLRARLLGRDGITWLVRGGPDADPAIDVIDRTRLSIAAGFGAPEVAIGADGIGVANLDGDPRLVGIAWRVPCSTQSGLEIEPSATGRVTFRVVAHVVRTCAGPDLTFRLAIRFSEPIVASEIDARIEFPT